ncbi:hypothetical protein [Wolbachia endosymbiont (group A) of Anomoia purmunda]|uniref:hypothetical protein n=1 Tax=Wolbachia endosymbiont (group A) of Anomoia purmunda TaxID=2953978 RepID=UPI00222EBAD4|nr:hypothetical protein [Wolbachia endosymbiont (group A) of Anomoia purmunda]
MTRKGALEFLFQYLYISHASEQIRFFVSMSYLDDEEGALTYLWQPLTSAQKVFQYH